MITAIAFAFSVAITLAPAQTEPEVTANAILGIEVGMPIVQVRDALAPYGSLESRPTREGGSKEVWRLTGTGFDWIALKADARGRVVWITGHRRSGHGVRFDSIRGAPRPATDDTAVWHTTGRFGAQRLTLRGRGRVAEVVTLAEVTEVREP